jgi:FKBP-type peptidyl-prolyl cis-trans isomerase SlyD
LDTQEKPKAVADDVVVSIDYKLTVDGEVVDSTEGDAPLNFLQGHQNIIPGLERELAGMKIGDSKKVVVPPAEAYGEVDPDNIIDVPRSEFPSEIPMEAGTELEVKNADGEILSAVINDVSGDTVKLDFNHPLAGKQLSFDVTIVDLRAATDEELAHGHAHDEDGEFDYEEDEDFDDELDEELDEDLDYEDYEDEDEEEDDGHSPANTRH